MITASATATGPFASVASAMKKKNMPKYSFRALSFQAHQHSIAIVNIDAIGMSVEAALAKPITPALDAVIKAPSNSNVGRNFRRNK